LIRDINIHFVSVFFAGTGGMLQPTDKRLVEKIQILVGEGVRNVDEMKRHLRHFVKNDLFAGQTPHQSQIAVITPRMWT